MELIHLISHLAILILKGVILSPPFAKLGYYNKSCLGHSLLTISLLKVFAKELSLLRSSFICNNNIFPFRVSALSVLL